MSDKDMDYWLNAAHVHKSDYDWLDLNSDRIYQAILKGIYSKGVYLRQATQALFTVSRYTMTRLDYRRWWKLYLDAIVLATNSHDYFFVLDIMARLGQGYLIDGKIDSARRVFLRVINDTPLEDLAGSEQAMLAYIGLIKVESWDYSEDFVDDRLITQALSLAQRVGDRLLTELLYQALASAYAHRGQTEEAIGYSLTALGYSFQRRDFLHAAMTALVLATAYRNKGMIPQAKQGLKFVHQMLERVDHPQVCALAAYEQGVLCYYQQEFALADEWMHKAYAAFQALHMKRHITMTVHMLGLIATETGAFELAETRLKQAFEEWQAHNNVYEQTSVRYDLGALAERRGERDLARQYMHEALGISAAITQTKARLAMVEMIEAFLKTLN
jgi:tetratricopeptide (TPR) repeat protein